jgi:hypothetical protein
MRILFVRLAVLVVLAWFPKAFTGGWTLECNSPRASGRARALIVELEGGPEIELPASAGSGVGLFGVRGDS